VGHDGLPVASEVRVAQLPDGVSVVSLIGEHDLATRNEIQAALESALDSGDNLVVDLSSADFIDSSTLHVLVTAARRASESGRGFSVVMADNDTVRQVFELTGLLTQFARASSVEAAAAAFRRPA
jgi:anti-anti-sigma factor